MTRRSWIRSLFARPATRTIRNATRRARLRLEALEDRAVPATFTVLNTNDGGAGSLRQAIDLANASVEADSIVFNDGTLPGTNFLDSTPYTITLTSGQLTLTDSATTTISGPGANLLSISGNNASRVFGINFGSSAELSGLTITEGNAERGGGVFNAGTATLTNCTVSGNTAFGYFGGGVCDSGTATLTNCTLSGNTVGLYGGGLCSLNGSTTLTNCTVTSNTAGVSGGGIEALGTVTVTNSTLTANQATNGGAIDNFYGRFTVTVGNSILAGNSASYGPDVLHNVVSLGHNLIGKIDDSTGWVGSDLTGTIARPLNALLAPLDNYGGPTLTMSLLPGSPAINAGTSGAGILATDQRGVSRFGAVDIGAFESEGFTLTPVADSTPQTSNIGTPFANLLAVTVSANNGLDPVDGGVIHFVAHSTVDGATAIFSTPSAVITGAQAATSAQPNNATGSYEAVASATEGTSASFALTNAGPVFTSLVVNTTSGSLTPGTGQLSLRQAVAFANLDNSGISTITFDPIVFAASQMITLGGSPLELSNPSEAVTIIGPAAGLTISAGGLDRVFQVDAGVTAFLSGLTITGGSAEVGGGLLNSGTVTLTDCTVSGNSADGNGTGLFNEGTATLLHSTVSGNYVNRPNIVSNIGGAVFNSSVATLTLIDSAVSGNGGGGLFNEGTATLTDCSVSGNTEGIVFVDGNSGSLTCIGGGVFNSGTVTLTDCIVSGNSLSSVSTGDSGEFAGTSIGGGVFNSGTATLTNCTLSDNVAFGFGGGNGGGMFNSGTAMLTNCTLSANFIGGYYGSGNGGGVFNSGTATLTTCTVNDNVAFSSFGGSFGGGVFNGGTVTLTNCTLSGNNAWIEASFGGGSGGGVFNSGTVTLTNCTISRNGSDQPYSSGWGVGLQNSGTATLNNTIVAGQFNSADVVGTITGSNNLIGGNPLLAPLADNGGPTQTMALLPGSPAINSGTSGPDVPTTDQRGVDRVGAVDIGAFESRGFTLAYVSGSNQSAPINSAFAAPLVVQVASHFGEPVAGGVVTFTAPGSGASTTTAVTTAVIDASGQASLTVTANGTGGSYDVTASANGAAGTADFHLTNGATTASISGVVYVDVNQNGLFDGNEPGLDGVTIELQDSSGNVLDTTTTVGGFYLFDGLNPGTYRIHEIQPSGVADGSEHLGSLGGAVVANDVMQLTLDGVDATDYVFAELGQQVTGGDAAGIGFWQNKHGQALIKAGGTGLADWLTANFGSVFGNVLAGASGADVAAFYKNQLFAQTGKSAAGPAKVDAQFMAVALAAYFTNRNLAGNVASSYGFNVTDTGLGARVVNVGSAGAAFGVSNGATLTVMQLLQATNARTDTGNAIAGFAHLYDSNGDGMVSAAEAQQRALANGVFTFINESGDV